jgi:hypothetical protein
MPAASAAEAERLAGRARALLKADGTISGPALTVGGREYMRGDRLVVLKEDADAEVPAGALGTVERVDPATGAMQVDFAALGRLRLRLSDSISRGLRHDYAEVRSPAAVAAPMLPATDVQPVAPGMEL